MRIISISYAPRALLLLSAFLLCCTTLLAQNVAISSDGSPPDSSALLDLQSTTSGLLIPRMSSAERNSIPSPAVGLMVYDTDTDHFWCWAGSSWIRIMQGYTALIHDADNDTEVNVEQTADEDMIRFKMGGNEYFRMDSGRLEVVNTGGSVFIGHEAGKNDNLSERRNVYIGHRSGYTNAGGSANIGVGYESLLSGQDVFWNTAVGYGALKSNISGNANTAYGFQALNLSTSGIINTAVGYRAMENNLAGSGNTALGYKAGFENVGSGNVYLGNSAGYFETGDNKLYIANTDTTAPLIYGEFDHHRVGINGQLAIGQNIADSSAVLDISSTSRGALLPRMTSAERMAISGPSDGLIVFDLDTGSFWYFDGVIWKELAPGVGSALSDDDMDTKVEVEASPDDDHIRFLTDSIERVVITPYGRMGIGDTSQQKLTVVGDIRAGEINTVIYVDSLTYPTIQAAIDSLPDEGGKVVIPGGIYTLTSPIVLPTNNIYIEGMGASTVIRATSAMTLINANEKDNIRIENLSLTFQSAPVSASQRGIDLKNSSCSTIANCSFNNCYYGIYLWSNGQQCTGNRVLYNQLRGGAIGVYLYGSLDSTTGNFVGVNKFDSVGTAVLMSGIRCVGNTVYGNSTMAGNIGIQTSSAPFNSVIGNVCMHPATTGISCLSLSGSNNLIAENFVLASDGEGIKVTAPHTKVTNNRIDTTGGHGIMLSNAKECRVIENTVLHSGDDGIHSTGSDCEILSNRIDDSQGEGIYNSGHVTAIMHNKLTNSFGHGIQCDGNLSHIIGNLIEGAGDSIQGHGMLVSGVEVRIHDNDIGYCERKGIYATGSQPSIGGNKIHHCLSHPVHTEGSYANITGNLIHPSYVTPDTVHGVLVESGFAVINANTLINVHGNGIYVQGAYSVVSDNFVYSAGINAMKSEGEHVNINSNIVYNDGILVEASSNTVASNKIRYGRIVVNSNVLYTTIEGNYIKDGNYDGITYTGSNGRIYNNTIVNKFGHGIYTAGANNMISHNFVDDIGNHGILIVGVGSEYHSNIIADNFVRDCNNYGVNLQTGYSIVRDNVIDSVGQRGINILGDNILVSRNRIRNSAYGVLADGDTITVQQNIIKDVSRGIWVGDFFSIQDVHRIQILDNSITGASQEGIFADQANDCRINGNYIENVIDIGIEVIQGLDLEVNDNKIKNAGFKGIEIGGDRFKISQNTLNVTDSVSIGININGLQQGTVIGNNIRGPGNLINTRGLSLINSSNGIIVVTGNTTEFFTHGFYFDNSQRIVVGNNITRLNGQDGFYFEDIDHSTVTGNVSYGNVGDEFLFASGNTNVIFNGNSDSGGSTNTAGCTTCVITDNQ